MATTDSTRSPQDIPQGRKKDEGLKKGSGLQLISSINQSMTRSHSWAMIDDNNLIELLRVAETESRSDSGIFIWVVSESDSVCVDDAEALYWVAPILTKRYECINPMTIKANAPKKYDVGKRKKYSQEWITCGQRDSMQLDAIQCNSGNQFKNRLNTFWNDVSIFWVPFRASTEVTSAVFSPNFHESL